MRVRKPHSPVKYTISDYVSGTLESCDYEDGRLESASRVANNSARAIGRLVEILQHKGILSLEEVSEIAAGYDEGLEVVPE